MRQQSVDANDDPLEHLEDRDAQYSYIFEQIANSKWDKLLDKDELVRELKDGRIMNGYTSLTPQFAPTFKRNAGTSLNERVKMDSFGNETEDMDPKMNARLYYNAKRLPSYTDRILYKSLPGFANDLKSISFESCEDVKSSDHKPVKASFNVLTKLGSSGIYTGDTEAGSIVFDITGLKVQRVAQST
jgi:hypothetical protein